MQLHAGTWGHVAVSGGLVTPAMQAMEEAGEMAMLRCRYAGKMRRARVSLLGFLPDTHAIIFNPNTLRDLANLFETDIERVFA